MIPTAVGPPWISALMSCASVLVARRIGAPMFAYLSCTHCPWRLSNIVVAESNRTATLGSGTLSTLPDTTVSVNTYMKFRYGTAIVLNGNLLSC